MDIKQKIKKVFHRTPRKTDKKTDVPSSWAKKNMKTHTSREIRYKSSKIHVPMLKPIKRGIAGVLCVLNFVISQLTLMSNPSTQWMSALFFLNAFIIFDYLWKTRGAAT